MAGLKSIERVSKFNYINKISLYRVVVFFIVLIIVILVYRNIAISNSITSLEKLNSGVDKLYTSSSKSDIKESLSIGDLGVYFVKAEDFGSSNLQNKKSLLVELNTILQYVEDRDLLENVVSKDFDLKNEEYLNTLSLIESSLTSYSVQSLKLTMQGKIEEAKEEYNEFLNIENTIHSLTELNYFDVKSIQKRINSIHHYENRENLQESFDVLKSKHGFVSGGTGDISIDIYTYLNKIQDSIINGLDNIVGTFEGIFSRLFNK